jgi:TetR/AcrR family transcriptional repressor of nem operon
MRVTREKAAENRERIVAAAARLFREKGFEGVGVDAIMEDVGLTHGGFYRHFRSKDDLAAEAVARGLAVSAGKQDAFTSLQDHVSGYLSAAHRDDLAGGCMIAALGCEIARQGPTVRRRLTAHVRGAPRTGDRDPGGAGRGDHARPGGGRSRSVRRDPGGRPRRLWRSLGRDGQPAEGPLSRCGLLFEVSYFS